MRVGLKAILCLIAIAALVLLALGIGKLGVGVLRASRQETGEPDPMFDEAPAQTAAAPTVTDDGARFYDNSANWDVPEHTPVEQTAEELAREDAQSSN